MSDETRLEVLKYAVFRLVCGCIDRKEYEGSLTCEVSNRYYHLTRGQVVDLADIFDNEENSLGSINCISSDGKTAKVYFLEGEKFEAYLERENPWRLLCAYRLRAVSSIVADRHGETGGEEVRDEVEVREVRKRKPKNHDSFVTEMARRDRELRDKERDNAKTDSGVGALSLEEEKADEPRQLSPEQYADLEKRLREKGTIH